MTDEDGHTWVTGDDRRERVAVERAGSGPSARDRSWWAGGADRRTTVGRPRRAGQSSQASWSSPSRPGSTRPVSSASTSESSITNRTPRRLDDDPRRDPEPGDERVPHVVVAGTHRERPVPPVEPRPRLGVLLGESVVGHVAGDDEDVGSRVHGEEVVHHGAVAGGGVLHVVTEVGVTDVGDHEHAATLAGRASDATRARVRGGLGRGRLGMGGTVPWAVGPRLPVLRQRRPGFPARTARRRAGDEAAPGGPDAR